MSTRRVPGRRSPGVSRAGSAMEPYKLLAQFYDEGWGDYSAYVAQLISEIERESERRFSRVCDAACGTGLLLHHLADGRRIAGYDRSTAMLDIARTRVPTARLAVGDLCEPIPFDETFELVTAVYDSLNYLHREEELVRFFSAARGVITDDGLLLIDLNDRSMYPPERHGAARDRIIDGIPIREQLMYDAGPPPVATTVFEFPFGREEHPQRPWEADEIEALLAEAGWYLLDTLDVMDDDSDLRSGKVVYLAIP